MVQRGDRTGNLSGGPQSDDQGKKKRQRSDLKDRPAYILDRLERIGARCLGGLARRRVGRRILEPLLAEAARRVPVSAGACVDPGDLPPGRGDLPGGEVQDGYRRITPSRRGSP